MFNLTVDKYVHTAYYSIFVEHHFQYLIMGSIKRVLAPPCVKVVLRHQNYGAFTFLYGGNYCFCRPPTRVPVTSLEAHLKHEVNMSKSDLEDHMHKQIIYYLFDA